MQDKSHIKSPIYDRVENLRVQTNRSWDQVAELLEIDRSMFFHVKKGRRNLSKKAIYRLEEAERAAGIPSSISVINPPFSLAGNEGEKNATISARVNERESEILKAVDHAITALTELRRLLGK